MTFSTVTIQGPRRLIQRVYTLAQKEAREARERRDLPFGGLFPSAASEHYLPLVAMESNRTSGTNAQA